MSLTKLIMAPIKLFRKDVITFLIVRRHDLSSDEEKLLYIAVKPNASVLTLRHKVWHLLDLPDYCEEVIILKSNDKEIPLTELRKGNDPHRPYTLEVWLPGMPARRFSTTAHNMLTIGNGEETKDETLSDSTYNINTIELNSIAATANVSLTTINKEPLVMNKLMTKGNTVKNMIQNEDKKSELSCRISSSSMFLKLQGRKSRQDSFTSILLKIQTDLTDLSNKLSVLETRIPSANN